MPAPPELVTIVCSACLLAGCLGTRLSGGVRVTPGAPHPVEPEAALGLHPAQWFPSQAQRTWDAGVGGVATGDHGVGVYLEGTRALTQSDTGYRMPLANTSGTDIISARTSAGAALRWDQGRGSRPELQGVLTQEVTGFSGVYTGQEAVWGETALGVYLGVDLCGCRRWSFSAGASARLPVVGMDKM